MVDIELVQEKLRALEEYIRELETYQCLSREKLESSIIQEDEGTGNSQ